jgi:hypothetical protein
MLRVSFADFAEACVGTALSVFPTDFAGKATGWLDASARFGIATCVDAADPAGCTD